MDYEKVVFFIKKNQPVDMKTIYDYLGMTRSAFKYHLKKLKSEFNIKIELKRVGNTRKNFLSLNYNNKENILQKNGEKKINYKLDKTKKIKNKLFIPNFEQIYNYSQNHKDNYDCKLILKYVKVNKKLDGGSGWTHPIIKALNIINKMLEEGNISEKKGN